MGFYGEKNSKLYQTYSEFAHNGLSKDFAQTMSSAGLLKNFQPCFEQFHAAEHRRIFRFVPREHAVLQQPPEPTQSPRRS